MSSVYNPESDVMAEIERLELEARMSGGASSMFATNRTSACLNRQLHELEEQIDS
jgi:hypothetical protein